MSAAAPHAAPPLPLEGVKVLDFSRLLPGPFATQMLGALGADVVKVEQPGIGDPSRHNHPRYRHESVYFHAANTDKRSIALDMANDGGQEVAGRLLAWADVAVESFRPGVAAKLGMDYGRARSINAGLVYCSISGFGQSGPLAKIAGHDLAIQALTGLMGCAPDGEAPVPGLQAADFAGALYAVIGIQAALAQRARTGRGCEVDIAMFEALFDLCFIPLSAALAQLAGHSGAPRMEVFGANPRYATYRTKDGRYAAITLLEAKAWREFCDHIGQPDLVSAEETPADRLGTHGGRAPLYRAGSQATPAGARPGAAHPRRPAVVGFHNLRHRSASRCRGGRRSRVRAAIIASHSEEPDMTVSASNTRTIARFVATLRERELPPEVLDTARLCLADWIGVALGAVQEPAARVVQQTSAEWKSSGRATVLLGGSTAAPVAALCNGTLAHCLDFDDTYVTGITHVSAPVWAATAAVGEECGSSEQDMLMAFVAGFETAARAGYGLGELVTARGWHGTGVFGRIGAAAATAALLRLDEERCVHALGAAATQASGLTASFGTMAKPFHAGKAAMDGVIAAQLAAKGFLAAEGLLESNAGLDRALIQDGSGSIRAADFSTWEILQNSFKPYAACHLTHPIIDAAKEIRAARPDAAKAPIIRAQVGALAKQVTGEKRGVPATGLEGKFDLKYCVALALHGRTLSAADFREPLHREPEVEATASRVEVAADSGYGFASARLQVDWKPGESLAAEVPIAKGHPGNPIRWDDMHAKFTGLIDERACVRAESLFARLREFGRHPKPDILHHAADIAAASG